MCNEYIKDCYIEKGQCMMMKDVIRQKMGRRKKTLEDKRDNV